MTDPAVPPAAPDAAAEAATIYRRAGVVTFFTLLSRIFGMARDLVVANRFGATGDTDAWVQGFRVPNALRRLTAEGSMTIAFVPIYVRVREREGPAAARTFAQRALGLVLLATAALTGLGMALAEPLTAVFSPGFLGDPLKFGLTAAFMRWTFPYLLLVSLVAWAMGALNAEGSFVAPAAAPVLLNVGIIAAVLGFGQGWAHPILVIAGGVLAGGVAQVALQLPSLFAHGLAPVPRAGWGDAHVRELFRLLLPALFGVAVYQLNIIVLGMIASFLPTGQVFHYHNATRLTELGMGLFTFAFTTAGLPTLSEHQAREDWARMGETVRLTFAAVAFTVLPTMAGLLGAAPAIVSVLYLHGAYGYADVLLTVAALRMLALGLPAVGGTRVMVPVFYALGDARTPVAVSAVTLVVTGLLGWQLSLRWQVAGLALGLSAGTWVQFGLLAWQLRRRAAHLPPWFPWREAGLQTVAAAVVGLAAAWAMDLGRWEAGGAAAVNWAVLGGTVGGGAALYLALTLLLGEQQARNWVRVLGSAARRAGRFRNRSQGGP